MGNMKDRIKEICKLSGSWLKNFKIDEKEYWNVEMNNKYNF